MKLPARGQIAPRVSAIAGSSYPAYIVQGDAVSVMIDSGINHLAPHYLAALTEFFGDPGRLDYLLLTHSHYDHAGSAGYLKRHLPGLKIAAHERVAALAQKESALETMNRLSLSHVELARFNPSAEDVALRPFTVDLVLKEGDELDLGGLTCRVYEVPGHTRDSLAYYLPELGALFPGDATGVMREGESGWIQVAFVASYEDYVDSLRRMISLEPEMVCLAHNWVLTGADAGRYLRRSLDLTFEYRELIERHLDAAGGDADLAASEILREEHDADGGAFKPSAGYLTNLAAQVKLIAGLRGTT
jgi:glyoxylase-like metal-dependent hydrolase (beta-lactamase superfamily II)